MNPKAQTDESLAHESVKVIATLGLLLAVATKKSVDSVTCSSLFPIYLYSRIAMRAGRNRE